MHVANVMHMSWCQSGFHCNCRPNALQQLSSSSVSRQNRAVLNNTTISTASAQSYCTACLRTKTLQSKDKVHRMQCTLAIYINVQNVQDKKLVEKVVFSHIHTRVYSFKSAIRDRLWVCRRGRYFAICYV